MDAPSFPTILARHTSPGWLLAGLLGATCGFHPAPAQAFWLLGFATGDTLPPGALGAIAGTGGQDSDVGNPRTNSFTPFLAHAGVRLGVLDNVDLGYRLTTLPLPYSKVGPTLGGEIDVKVRLTPQESPWQVALIGGGAYSYLQLQGSSRDAWSPGVDLTVSRRLSNTYTVISEMRYVYTAITSAPGGSRRNEVQAAGADLGTRIALTKTVALVPEIGVFDFNGQIGGRNESGVGFQYGAVLSFRLW
jgi:hypothetical protein